MATALSYKGTTSTTHELDEIEHIYNGTSEAIAYKYDTLGMVNSVNRTGMDMLMPAQSSAVYDPANRMVQFGGITINYDANGNPLHLNGMDLTWNQKSQLTHVSGAAAGPIEYRYDAMGRRVSKIVNSVTTNYLYDGLNLIAELDGDNNNAVKVWYVYAGLDRPLARVDASDGSVLYYHQDLLGSVIALTNSSGVVVTQYNYSPFGHTEVIGTDIDQPFRFTGREWDAETGLYYYRARYYSPDMRRFISEDPIRFAAGDVNFYAYVGSNPVNFRDPLGLYREDVHLNLTYQLAMYVDLPRNIALTIALADQALDEGATKPINMPELHFMRPVDAFIGLDNAIRKCDIEAFGGALHSYQDTFSHWRNGITSPAKHVVQSALALLGAKDPDEYNPYEDPLDMRMEEGTIRQLIRMNERLKQTF